MTNSRRLLLGAVSTLSYGFASGAAFAQNAVSGTEASGAAVEDTAPSNAPATQSSGAPAPGDRSVIMNEIVVTAQRRSQNLQDVGISVTALSGEQLVSLGLNDSVDIAKVASNVTTAGAWAGMMQQFTIRGVTQNDFADHVESVVAVYVDDTYISMLQGQLFGMFDLERVEVLKGPQGTLFGRNATGGLAHFITRRPTKTLQGYIEGTYGSYNRVRVEGAIGGPLTETVRARVSGFFERQDGYLKNRFPEETYSPLAFPTYTGKGSGQDLGGIKHSWAVRGQMIFDIADDVELWASAFYNDFVGSAAPYTGTNTVAIKDAAGNHVNTLLAGPNETCEIIQVGACVDSIWSGDADALRARPGGDFYGVILPHQHGRSTSVDFAPDNGSQFTTWGASAKITAAIGSATLTSVSDYKNFDKAFVFDLDSRPFQQFLWMADAHAEQYSQELRLNGKSGRLTWIGGGFFLAIDNDFTHGISALLNNSVFPINGWDQPRIAKLKTRSYSGFAQFEYDITDQFSFILGGRLTREVKDYSFEIRFIPTDMTDDPFTLQTGPGIPVPGFYQPLFTTKDSATLWMGKAQINYKPNDDLLLYAGVSRGVKAGSFNSVPLPESEIPYKPEELIAYEAGLKSTLFDGRARFNGSLFYYDYTNYQATRWVEIANVIINADAEFWGGEAEFAASLTDDLETMLNVGYQKNKVKDVPVGGVLKNVETTYAPNWTVSAMFRYTVPQQIAGGSTALQVDGEWHSKSWGNLNNFDADRIDDYTVVNGRVSWESEDRKFALAVFAKNIFQKTYEIIRYDTSILFGGNLSAKGKPRWIGVEGTVRF